MAISVFPTAVGPRITTRGDFLLSGVSVDGIFKMVDGGRRSRLQLLNGNYIDALYLSQLGMILEI
jgi:hypothetical protein